MRVWSTDLDTRVRRDGSTYRVRVIGTERSDGTWEGHLEFHDDKSGPLCTDEETSQPNRDAFESWTTGLELIYLEGALDRAAAGRNG